MRYDEALRIELGERVYVGLLVESWAPGLAARHRIRAADHSHVDEVGADEMTVQPGGVLRL